MSSRSSRATSSCAGVGVDPLMAHLPSSGVGVTLKPHAFDTVGEAFGEDQGHYLLVIPDENYDAARKLASRAGYTLGFMGTFGGDDIRASEMVHRDGGSNPPEERTAFSVPLATLRAAHEGWLPKYMAGGS